MSCADLFKNIPVELQQCFFNSLVLCSTQGLFVQTPDKHRYAWDLHEHQLLTPLHIPLSPYSQHACRQWNPACSAAALLTV